MASLPAMTSLSPPCSRRCQVPPPGRRSCARRCRPSSRSSVSSYVLTLAPCLWCEPEPSPIVLLLEVHSSGLNCLMNLFHLVHLRNAICWNIAQLAIVKFCLPGPRGTTYFFTVPLFLQRNVESYIIRKGFVPSFQPSVSMSAVTLSQKNAKTYNVT